MAATVCQLSSVVLVGGCMHAVYGDGREAGVTPVPYWWLLLLSSAAFFAVHNGYDCRAMQLQSNNATDEKRISDACLQVVAGSSYHGNSLSGGLWPRWRGLRSPSTAATML